MERTEVLRALRIGQRIDPVWEIKSLVERIERERDEERTAATNGEDQ